MDTLSRCSLLLLSTSVATWQLACGKTVVDVQGQSGKFTVYDEGQGKDSGVQVIMDALREVDASGNSVGTSGSVKHSINTFAAQSFVIDPVVTATLNGSDGKDGVNATKISFQSNISSIGKLRVDTYIMEDDGAAGPPNETWAVSAGDMKWNIELYDWTWCNGAPCKKGSTDEVGAFIDVDVSVKGKGDATKKTGSNKSLELGAGVTMELSNQVMVDGAWQQMPAGFPSVTVQGATTTLTFRFPKFTQRALYDPLLAGVGSGGMTTTPEDNTINGCNQLSVWAVSCLLMLGVVLGAL